MLNLRKILTLRQLIKIQNFKLTNRNFNTHLLGLVLEGHEGGHFLSNLDLYKSIFSNFRLNPNINWVWTSWIDFGCQAISRNNRKLIRLQAEIVRALAWGIIRHSCYHWPCINPAAPGPGPGPLESSWILKVGLD